MLMAGLIYLQQKSSPQEICDTFWFSLKDDGKMSVRICKYTACISYHDEDKYNFI